MIFGNIQQEQIQILQVDKWLLASFTVYRESNLEDRIQMHVPGSWEYHTPKLKKKKKSRIILCLWLKIYPILTFE